MEIRDKEARDDLDELREMKLKTCRLLVVSSLFIVLVFLFSMSPVQAVEQVYFLHQDHLGSTTLISKQDGTVYSQQVYYPYGSTRASSTNLPTEKQYTGQVSDQPQTGLYYYNARYYNPQTAKFNQADQTEKIINRYAYAAGNPLFYIDPSGKQELSYEEWAEKYLGGLSFPGADCADVGIWAWAMYAKYAGLPIDWYVSYKNLHLVTPGERSYEEVGLAGMKFFAGQNLRYLAGSFGPYRETEVNSCENCDLSDFAEREQINAGDVIYYLGMSAAEGHSLMVSKEFENIEQFKQYYQEEINHYLEIYDSNLAGKEVPGADWRERTRNIDIANVIHGAISSGKVPFYFRYALIESPEFIEGQSSRVELSRVWNYLSPFTPLWRQGRGLRLLQPFIAPVQLELPSNQRYIPF